MNHRPTADQTEVTTASGVAYVSYLMNFDVPTHPDDYADWIGLHPIAELQKAVPSP
jgi:hypothetical protein